jgi:primary-amine oxidase
MKPLQFVVAALLVPVSLSAQPAQSSLHPLDGMGTAEYWTVYDALQSAGHVTSETKFTSVLLHPPEKSVVLAWRPGQAVPREADVVLLRNGKSYTARVDVSAKRVVTFAELQGAHSAFLASEMFGADAYIKQDQRIIEALRKRGITDLRTVSCSALPVAYRAIPEQATQRIGFGSCSRTHGTYHSWGRSIEGLTFQVDVTAKKVTTIADTEVVAVPSSQQNYEEIPEHPRPYTTPISTVQPQGTGIRIDNGEISWQNWQFRLRLDPRLGVVLNLVRVVDQGLSRSVLYEASMSELFVPYMDTANGWNNRAFIDAGEFFAGSGFLKPLRSGLDCPGERHVVRRSFRERGWGPEAHGPAGVRVRASAGDACVASYAGERDLRAPQSRARAAIDGDHWQLRLRARLAIRTRWDDQGGRRRHRRDRDQVLQSQGCA